MASGDAGGLGDDGSDPNSSPPLQNPSPPIAPHHPLHSSHAPPPPPPSAATGAVISQSEETSEPKAAASAAVPVAAITVVISQPEEACEPKDASSTGEETGGAAAASPAPIGIVISQPEEASESKAAAFKGEEKGGGAAAATAKKLLRADSYDEQCRICQQHTEEPLIDLGCRCRGDLAKAHRSCIDVWFRTKGSNKCEICQQVAANIPSPETQSSTSYWVWRVDSAYGRGRGGHERGCFSPLWVAFAILIGGLLLDVLISVSLGVSALPVNIIIGVLIVLGLGTALRLALECCQEWGSRRSMPRLNLHIAPGGYHHAV